MEQERLKRDWESDGSMKAYLRDIRQWHDRSARRNKLAYQSVRLATVVLAATTPIWIALGGRATFAAIVTSVLVVIGEGALSLFRFQENWLRSRTTAEELKREKILFFGKVGEYEHAEDPDRLYVERVHAILSREQTMWAEIASKSSAPGT